MLAEDGIRMALEGAKASEEFLRAVRQEMRHAIAISI